MTSTELEDASTRYAVPGLGLARPMVTMLPSIFLDDFTERWLGAFDQVVAPVEVTLDCFTSYLDPDLSPSDFLAWVGSWLGATFDHDLPDSNRRALVRSIVDIYATRGTPDSIRQLIELTIPAACEIVEGGASVASTVPSTELPGSAVGAFVVRVRPTGEALTEHQRSQAMLLVEASRPAHLPGVVEFLDA